MPRWLIWTLIAVLCWGIWAVLGRLIGDALSPTRQQAFSTLGIVPVMIALLFSKKLVVTGNRRRGAGLAFGAGLLTCLGNLAYYDVLNRGAKAATVVPLTALYPMITVVLAILLLRERINAVQCAGLALSLAAIYLFNVQAGHQVATDWIYAALIPIAFWGLAGLLQKMATRHLSGELAALWFLGAFIPTALALVAVYGGSDAPLSLRTWLWVLALGFTFGVGNLALLAAFAANGKASVIAPLAGLYPVVSIPIAILLLNESIGWREGIAIALALAAVVAMSMESPPSFDQTPPRAAGENSPLA